MAKHFGAEIIATDAGDEHPLVIQCFGVTPIDFMTMKMDEFVAEYEGGAGFDVVFDTVGGPNLTNSIAAVALNVKVSKTVALLELDLTPAHFEGVTFQVVYMLIPMLHDQSFTHQGGRCVCMPCEWKGHRQGCGGRLKTHSLS